MKKYFHLLKDKEVLQIIHRGNGIKVALTQEYFLILLDKARSYNTLKEVSTK
jgi:hypothetical protein